MKTSFAATALELGGKSSEEVHRLGSMDRADEELEQFFAVRHQTTSSPIHRAVWDRSFPVELFAAEEAPISRAVQTVMDNSYAVVLQHQLAGSLFNTESKISEQVLEDLAAVGYWGLLIPCEYGGSGAAIRSFAPFLTRMATVDPTTAGLASVHGCIGAVDPLRTFGNAEQKKNYLPKLASGERLSAFALTEPCAGSDLTALRTRAVRRGEYYYVTGEKLFITNVVPGRTIGLVCLIEEQPAVLIVDLPERESEQFRLVKYGLYALQHTYNRGILFREFPVPVKNLLTVPQGNGLTIAYHGLNLGRVALCANAAGTMRLLLASMLPWAKFRKTYGEAIERRELVQRRIAKLAGFIVGCDALVAWCATLLDQGYRGEMECIVAKIFASEAQKEAAIELCMKTHGGRAFLHGHIFGDHVHEYLAPCIYEGEGEMLGMAFFKSLVKQHGITYFEPIGKGLAAAGLKTLNPLNLPQLWNLRRALGPYARWCIGECVGHKPSVQLPAMPTNLREHALFAASNLQRMSWEISSVMRKHQLKLTDRQCRMSELSTRVQKLVVMLCTSLYAHQQHDELVRSAADILCQDLTRELTGQRSSDRYYRMATELGAKIAEGEFPQLRDLPHVGEILMRYEMS
jgi:alkylation response protein AidB-like acyl-CoA dehydrogenase